MGVGAVDQFDAEAIESREKGVDAIGAFDLVGKEAADFFVSEITLGFALGDHFLEGGVVKYKHRSAPLALHVRLG